MRAEGHAGGGEEGGGGGGSGGMVADVWVRGGRGGAGAGTAARSSASAAAAAIRDKWREESMAAGMGRGGGKERGMVEGTDREGKAATGGASATADTLTPEAGERERWWGVWIQAGEMDRGVVQANDAVMEDDAVSVGGGDEAVSSLKHVANAAHSLRVS